MSQAAYKPHFEHLKNKWTERKEHLNKNIIAKHGESLRSLNHHVRNIALGGIGGLVLTTTVPNTSSIPIKPNVPEVISKDPVEPRVFLAHDLSNKLPQDVRPLLPEEEERIGNILSNRFGFPVTAEFEGKRLNRSYGYIGAEQHLMRYPGDTIATHFNPPAGGVEEAEKYSKSGMAPGRGAWGYFTNGPLTKEDIEREKYYIAVQTFLAPGFMQNVREYYQFFKYRKMLVVNPHTGRAMVVVIGDAGPAEWTGKHLGGSPEVMKYLERVDGRQKGPVLYFFIDDPENKIPLGPIEAK